MNNKYSETFNLRGHPYDQAMRRFPDSRNAEFLRLFDSVDFSDIQTVLDLPSGGGYLKKFLPDRCLLTSVDPSKPFQVSDDVVPVNLENLRLGSAQYDLIVSLAALHHVENKQGFLGAVSEALKPDGYFCVGDVAADSGISRFLDEFAGRYNGSGHSGVYLELDAPFPGLGTVTGLQIVEHVLKPCEWLFQSVAEMVEFCRLLFGLKGVSDQEIDQALRHYVGYSLAGECVILQWQLLYIVLKRKN